MGPSLSLSLHPSFPPPLLPTACLWRPALLTHSAEHTQTLRPSKLINCQFSPQITILHSLFSKHLNSIMYAQPATRNYRKLIHSSIPRSSHCSPSGCLCVSAASGHMRRSHKIEGNVQGAWSAGRLRSAQSRRETSHNVITDNSVEVSRLEMKARCGVLHGRRDHSIHFGASFSSQYNFSDSRMSELERVKIKFIFSNVLIYKRTTKQF